MSKKTILICGYGPGISHAMAKQFAAEGFSVAIVSRSADKLTAAARELSSAELDVRAFPADLGDQAAVATLVDKVREELGPITVIHWNALGMGAGDLTKDDPQGLIDGLNIAVTGLVTAVQNALPDLRAAKDDAAVLVTGGGLAFYDPQAVTMAVQWNCMGLAVAKAAQHKTVEVLAEKLAPEGIYVGELVVLALVKGTAFDQGSATLEPSTIAAKFYEMYKGRSVRTANIQ